jgi:hypothetical protein
MTKEGFCFPVKSPFLVEGFATSIHGQNLLEIMGAWA